MASLSNFRRIGRRFGRDIKAMITSAPTAMHSDARISTFGTRATAGHIAILLLLSTLAFGQLSDILRPTKDVDPGNVNYGCSTIGHEASSAMPKAYDTAGLTTFGFLSAIGDDGSGHNETRLFSSWATTHNSYTALSLNINASFDIQGSATACIKYSTDGGNTYATAQCSSAFLGAKTYTFTLSTTQDFAQLRVAACGFGTKGSAPAERDPGEASIFIYDIWTVGTNPAPATGNGSSSGQAHRDIVVSN